MHGRQRWPACSRCPERRTARLVGDWDMGARHERAARTSATGTSRCASADRVSHCAGSAPPRERPRTRCSQPSARQSPGSPREPGCPSPRRPPRRVVRLGKRVRQRTWKGGDSRPHADGAGPRVAFGADCSRSLPAAAAPSVTSIAVDLSQRGVVAPESAAAGLPTARRVHRGGGRYARH